MPFNGIVGEIYGPHKKLEVEWKVENFFSLSNVVDDRYHSPTFDVSGNSFYLKLYPNAERNYDSEGYIGLYLMLSGSCSPIEIQYTFGIKTSEGHIEHWFSETHTFGQGDVGSGDSNELHRTELLRRKRELVPSGTLTITVTLNTGAPNPNEDHKSSPVGKIREGQCTPDCKEMIWEIDDALRLFNNKSISFCPTFSFGMLEVQLVGNTMSKRFAIFLSIKGTSSGQLIWSAGILRADGVEYLTGSGKVAMQEDRTEMEMVGTWLGPSQSELLREKDMMIPKEVLTLFFRISTETAHRDSIEVAVQTDDAAKDVEEYDGHLPSDKTGLTTLGRTLKDLYKVGKDCDVTVKVKEKEFHAHRLILGARTPALAAMFSHNMVEAETGVVCVEDCHPDAFEVFLLFVYSGMAENLTTENVTHVYYIADKYDLPELKEECVRHMLSTLATDSVCSILDLATRHNEEVLLEKATEFFLKNAREIFRTTTWRQFMIDNNTLASDLIIRSHENVK